MMERWIYVEVNPTPWATGAVSTGRKNGKTFARMGRNQEVAEFQESLREALADEPPLQASLYDLKFYFYRRIEEWNNEAGRKVNSHIADATNLQKSTEDALQGVLIGNDCNVRRICSEIVEQGKDVKGCIVIRLKPYVARDGDIPEDIYDRVNMPETEWMHSDNSWPPRG